MNWDSKPRPFSKNGNNEEVEDVENKACRGFPSHFFSRGPTAHKLDSLSFPLPSWLLAGGFRGKDAAPIPHHMLDKVFSEARAEGAYLLRGKALELLMM